MESFLGYDLIRVRRDHLFRDRDETDTRPGQSLETETRPRPAFYQIFETETRPRLLEDDFPRPRRDRDFWKMIFRDRDETETS